MVLSKLYVMNAYVKNYLSRTFILLLFTQKIKLYSVHNTISDGKDASMRSHLATKCYTLYQCFYEEVTELELETFKKKLVHNMKKPNGNNNVKLINQKVKQKSVGMHFHCKKYKE